MVSSNTSRLWEYTMRPCTVLIVDHPHINLVRSQFVTHVDNPALAGYHVVHFV